jgi:hypothetical protein
MITAPPRSEAEQGLKHGDKLSFRPDRVDVPEPLSQMVFAGLMRVECCKGKNTVRKWQNVSVVWKV